MNCRVCGTTVEVTQSDVPFMEAHRIFTHEPIEAIFVSAKMFECKNCGLVQVDSSLSHKSYSTYNESNGFGSYQPNLNCTEKYIEKLKEYSYNDGGSTNIFEIGSGGGNALKIAKKHFDRCVGVEPATNLYEQCVSDDLEVCNAYFDEYVDIGDCYDAFMSFQVFEHLENPKYVLKEAFDRLKPGGVGLINVPNGKRIVQQGLFHQLILEHINYFTLESLVILAKSIGFDVIEISENRETIELNIFIEKPSAHDGFNIITDDLSRKLKKALEKYDSLALWGAGGRCTWYYNLLPEGLKIQYFFDNDINKAGMYTQGIPMKIVSPNESKLAKVEAVLVLASAYNDLIISDLRMKYNFCGDVVYFDGNKICLNNYIRGIK